MTFESRSRTVKFPMKPREPIAASILLTMSALFAVQCVFFAGISVRYGLRLRIGLGFLATSFVYHGILVFLLLRRTSQFQIEPDGVPLKRVNLANILTMIRLSSLPTVCFMIVLQKSHPLLPLLLAFVIVVFLTDLLDGNLSRLTHQVTKIGRVMDSFSDYLVLMVISIAFLAYGLVPAWFFAAIFVRGFTMIIGMAILTRKRGYLKPETSFIGKASVFAVMVLYAYTFLRMALATSRWAETVDVVLVDAVGAFVVVSIVDKLLYFRIRMREASRK